MMVNCTSDFVEGCTYNLSKLFNNDVINAPHNWLGAYNGMLDGYPIIMLLAVIGILLYLGIKKTSGYDSEAAVYSGIITTFFGIILFLIRIDDGTKLVTWPYLVPFVVLTFVAIIANYVNKRFA